jgi:hypothetical protein
MNEDKEDDDHDELELPILTSKIIVEDKFILTGEKIAKKEKKFLEDIAEEIFCKNNFFEFYSSREYSDASIIKKCDDAIFEYLEIPISVSYITKSHSGTDTIHNGRRFKKNKRIHACPLNRDESISKVHFDSKFKNNVEDMSTDSSGVKFTYKGNFIDIKYKHDLYVLRCQWPK